MGLAQPVDLFARVIQPVSISECLTVPQRVDSFRHPHGRWILLRKPGSECCLFGEIKHESHWCRSCEHSDIVRSHAQLAWYAYIDLQPYLYSFIHTDTCHKHTHTQTHAHLYLSISISVSISISISIYVSIHMHMHTYVYNVCVWHL